MAFSCRHPYLVTKNNNIFKMWRKMRVSDVDDDYDDDELFLWYG